MESRDDPRCILREHHRGVLEVSQSEGEWTAPARFIIDGHTGSLVTPVGIVLDGAESAVLLVPDESSRSLQVHLAPEAIVEWRSSEACDRWLAYFGRSEGSHWYRLLPIGYRLGRRVVDPDEVPLVNPLHGAEARLCKLANSQREALGRVAVRLTGDPGATALCVGIDPHGMDLRVPLGILRVDFAVPAPTGPEAEAALGTVLDTATRRA